MFRAGFRDLPDSCGNTTALIRNVYDGRATDSEAGKPVRRLFEHDARRGDFIPSSVVAPSSRCLERKTDGILSLASGTFVLLVRLFFFVLAAKVPLAGLRKENGKLKVRYEFVNGEISEIEVDDNLGELLVDFDRQEYNNDHKETRRHTSLDGMEYEGEAFLSPADTEEQVLKREDMARLLRAMEALTPAQRELVRRVYFENESIAAVARSEGVHESSIRERLRWIYKKLKKFLE